MIASIAQLAEILTCNQEAKGSSPSVLILNSASLAQ